MLFPLLLSCSVHSLFLSSLDEFPINIYRYYLHLSFKYSFLALPRLPLHRSSLDDFGNKAEAAAITGTSSSTLLLSLPPSLSSRRPLLKDDDDDDLSSLDDSGNEAAVGGPDLVPNPVPERHHVSLCLEVGVAHPLALLLHALKELLRGCSRA